MSEDIYDDDRRRKLESSNRTPINEKIEAMKEEEEEEFHH